MENIRKTIAHKQEISIESQTVVAGQPRWYYTNLQPYRDAGGEVVAALVIATDMTERKEAGERLLAAQEEKYRQAKEIAGGVAHEIHNALCPATNALEKLKERLSFDNGNDAKRNQDLLDLSETAVYRAMSMTQLVTTYSRLDAEKSSQPVNLSSVVIFNSWSSHPHEKSILESICFCAVKHGLALRLFRKELTIHKA
jgi:signal transduction histidine kinase